MAVLAFIGRILFGLYFIQAGFNHFARLDMMAGYAGAKSVPAPKFGVAFSGLMLLFGGVTTLLGVWMPAAGIVLAVALLLFSFYLHNFWTVTDPGQRMAETTNFFKNLGLVAASLMLSAMPATVWHL